MSEHEHGHEQQQGETAERAERIAAEGESVRERVRRLVVDAAGGQTLGLSSLRRVADEVLRGASEAAARKGEPERRGVLHETISGISDGLASAAQATRLAIEEAEGRGARFSKEDLGRAADDLRTLERMLVDVVRDVTGRAATEVRGQSADFVEHAKRAADSMRPSIERAVDAATRNPGKLAGEAAGAGVDTARGALGSLLGVAAGLLDAAAEVVSGEKKPADHGKPGTEQDRPGGHGA